MTGKQESYLKALLAERPSWAASQRINFENLDTKQASKLIEQALRQPREKKAPKSNSNLPLDEITPGSYWTESGKVARVRKSMSGRLYAEVLAENERFEFVRGAIFHLKARMTLAEAKAWGAQHGRCCVCAAFLTDPKSIEQGIGPVCIKKI